MADLKMPDLNRVTLAGRLTRDPELRYLSTGTALCKLGIAVSRFSKSKDGEKKEETLFIGVTCWAKTAEYVGEYFEKGQPVLVEGRLQSSEWTDKEGNKRVSIDVTADRIQGLDWHTKKGAGDETQQPSDIKPGASEPDDEPLF